MPLEVISSETAWNSAYRNKHGKYPTPRSGADRLFPFPQPAAKTSFKIDPDAQIYSMGSCFAREIDVALAKSGFKVISRSTPLSRAVDRDSNDRQLFNKYTVQTILNEVRWALDPAQPYPGEAALVQTGEDEWMDLQTGGEQVRGTLANMLRFRASYCGSIRKLADADVVIISLGMVESWYDTKSALHANLAAPLEACEKWPGRFELHILTYAEVLAALEELHVLIVKHGKPGVRLLVAVDPIPQQVTFRETDVLLANTYAKSVQRAAAEAFVTAHGDVDYFPTFECVALSDPGATFTREDFRHLPQAVVERVVSTVMAGYVAVEKLDPPVAAKAIVKLAQEKRQMELAKMAARVEWNKLDAKTLYFLGNGCRQAGEYEVALGVFAEIIRRPDVPRNALENALMTARLANQPETIPPLLAKHEALFPEATAFRASFAERESPSIVSRILAAIKGLAILAVCVPMVISGFVAIVAASIIGVGTSHLKTATHALDCFLNATLFNGLGCESVASHAWRYRHVHWGRIIVAIMNLVEPDYCEKTNRREQPFVDLALSKGLQKKTLFY